MQPVISVFLKLPVPGRVKTRLAAPVGAGRAAEIYAELVRLTLEQVPVPGGGQRPCRVIMHYDPPDAGGEVRRWLHGLPGTAGAVARTAGFQAQTSGDLGARMEAAARQALADGGSAVALVGTDCPWLRPHHFDAAWGLLEGGADVVFGPAEDGGYWLIAMRKVWPEAFRDIPWSTPDTLVKSLAALELAGAKVEMLETLRDIDHIQDWEQYRQHDHTTEGRCPGK